MATNFSRWRPPTCDLVARKKNEKSSSRESFAKKAGRLGSEHSFFHSSASVSSRTKHRSRNSHLPRVCEVLQYCSAVQCRACAAGAFHTCGCKIDNRETKLHHLPTHNSKADLRFLHCYTSRKKADGSRADILPFRFGSIACETRIAKLSPVTCMRATALCFQPLLFPHVWWRELKDTITITARFFRKRRRADRQHELPSSVFVCETRIAKLRPVTCMRRCYSVQRWGDQAVARVAHVSALQMQRKAYLR